MKIEFKDVLEFKKLVLKSGYNFAELSKVCNKNKTALLQSTRTNSISPVFAKAVCDRLGKTFDDLFIIVEK